MIQRAGPSAPRPGGALDGPTRPTGRVPVSRGRPLVRLTELDSLLLDDGSTESKRRDKAQRKSDRRVILRIMIIVMALAIAGAFGVAKVLRELLTFMP